MADFTRPKEGFRFVNGGLKTNSSPDSIPDGKYPALQNVRATRNSSLHTRPGLAQLALTDGQIITDLRTYTQIETDNKPRILARDVLDHIWLDTGTQVGSLTPTGPPPPGASMLPFRPAQSPSPYMYIANGQDYQKFSAPSLTNVVTQQNVGIAEPQAACDAAFAFQEQSIVLSNPYTNGGTAGGISVSARTTDTAGTVFADPALFFLYSVRVSANVAYSRFETCTIGSQNFHIQDVFPAAPTPILIQRIYYFSGSAGRCIIVPDNMGGGTVEQSSFLQTFLSGLRRGSLIQLSSGSEVCYVWSVTNGPDGTVAIETSTLGAHAAGETVTAVAAIQILGGTPTVGQTITTPSATYGAFASTIGTGIGTLTSPSLVGANPFVLSTFTFQDQDYIHFSVLCSDLSKLNEVKILIDVDDGSFTLNYYFFAVRPNDIAAGVANTLTQLGVAQLVAQRATIDEEAASETNNYRKTHSSAQTDPGSQQWAEIIFPIGQLTRVGNDQSKSLATTAKVQFLINASASVSIRFCPMSVLGGFQADVGLAGAPYRYLARPRSSVTGAKGNPTSPMRYGVNPIRAKVVVSLPSAAYDPQIDTWDIFRYGGSVTSYRFIGSTPTTASQFIDNFTDDAALAGDEIEYDNHQPWPSVDVPFLSPGTNNAVTGTTALVADPTSASNIGRFLPGTKVQIGGQNVYTLYTRPTFVSNSLGVNIWLLQFVENAGVLAGPSINIYEPDLAQQRLPYMWGPDAQGTVFAVGDPLRPGTFYTTKPYIPDSAPAEGSYNQELTPPTEPLLGGEIIDGLSYVASSEAWWALYPQLQNPEQHYNPIKQAWPRGLASPYGHTNDNEAVYWWAKDGIWSSKHGSLTDEDLYNLFPHDGVLGQTYTYADFTVQPPDYSKAAGFRLVRVGSFLYALYQDATNLYWMLVLDLRTMAWCVDVYNGHQIEVTAITKPEQPAGTLVSTATQTYPRLILATLEQADQLGERATISQELNNSNDLGAPIFCTVATREFDGGDIRAGEQWGDMLVDAVAPAVATALAITPMSNSSPAFTAQPFSSPTRQQFVVSLGGELLVNFLGVRMEWTDDFATQASPTTLYIWQPSFIPKPETIQDRVTDWYDAGGEGAKWFQGFLLHADTFDQPKALIVRDSDTLTTHAFTQQVVHNGESIHPYSFVVPFVAHSVRIEPVVGDTVPWRFFDVEWVTEPTPELAETWQTQGTSFGLQGYSHIQRIVAAYSATAPVTLTITSFDGQSPMPVSLPSTGGAYQKLLVVLTANKGQLYFFQGVSSAPWQAWWDDFEIIVGNWGRQGPYVNYRSLGGKRGDSAHI